MKLLSRAGSSRMVMVSSRDLIFLWGMMSIGVSPVNVCSERMGGRRRIWAKWCLGVFMGCLGGCLTPAERSSC